MNPFKFGMIGSTDGHNTYTTFDEGNFFGKFPESEPGIERTKSSMAGALWDNWSISASGYAAVWAQENTRESLFAAMKRREVYATSGTRITVRFFGGLVYTRIPIFSVPTGWILPTGTGCLWVATWPAHRQARLRRFLLLPQRILTAPPWIGCRSSRAGWTADGRLHEKVYNVAWSGNRAEDDRGRLPPVGSTVDIATASYRNTIGATELSAAWTDPDFDAAQRAFYYLRVIEIPTPRWTAYDAVYFNLTDLDERIPMIVQDRAYTSPIWYTP